jgi:putative ABC transport system permease protein
MRHAHCATHKKEKIMFKNYLKIALRNIKRHKGYSFINVTGLAIGMAMCILILLYVQNELGYDSFHEFKDRIYRIERLYLQPDGSVGGGFSTLAPSFVPFLEADFPEVEHAVRMYQPSQVMIAVDRRSFIEHLVFFAEHDFFEVFSISLVQGDPEKALLDPYQAVISRTMADKYFGNDDPIGQELMVDDQFPFRVTGVMEDTPSNSHIHFDFLLSYETLRGFYGYGKGENDYFCGTTNFSDNVTLVYARLSETADINDIQDRIPAFLDRNLPSRTDDQGAVVLPSQGNSLYFRKVTDVHLHPHPFNEVEPGSDVLYVRLFALIAVFILLIACINFINLSTARAAKRAREVGLRKVVGAYHRMLIVQFLSESLLIAFVSILVAIVLVMLAVPYFSAFTGHDVSLQFGDPLHLVGIIGVFLVTGIVAGLYPALYMSVFDPASILRGEVTRGKRGAAFRKVLVVFQFAISVALMICVGIVYKQMHFIDSIDLGYDRENIVMFPADRALKQRWPELKAKLLRNPGIVHVTMSKRAPTGRLGDRPGFSIEIDGELRQNPFSMPHNRVEHDFFRTYGMTIVAGRDFSVDHPTDSLEAFIINEEAVRRLGLEKPGDAVGLPIGIFGHRRGRVIGVVKDFNYEPLHVRVKPIITYIRLIEGNTIAVRVKQGYIDEAIRHIKNTIDSYIPGHPVNYSFLDDRIDALYRNEQRMMAMFGYFSLLAILISCLGLFGLASFTAEQKTKEIGIRKVLGAMVSTIVFVLSKDFLKWVIIANVIAWPVAYFTMNKWLESFAYRTEIGAAVFLGAAFLSLLIAMGTVSYHTVKAALANPVESLRYE